MQFHHRCLGFLGLPLAAVLLMWGWVALAPCPPLLHGLSFSQVVQDRHGTLLRVGLSQDEKYRIRVNLADVAPAVVQGLLLYEDRYFYQHFGINPLSLARAAFTTWAGGRRMGGSTITMQVARLRLGLDTTTIQGKIRQMTAALQLEYHYSKDQIMEAFFNLAPYGGNVEGIEAAARVYFHKPAARLTLSESLALTVVPQHPARRHPRSGPDFEPARQRLYALWESNNAGQDHTLGQAQIRGQGHALGSAGCTFKAPLRVYTIAELPFAVPHVTSALLDSAVNSTLQDSSAASALPDSSTNSALPALSPSPAFSSTMQVFRTTLDMPAQELMEGMLRRYAARGRAYGLDNAAALLIHWPTMEIRALVGSADFHNTAIEGQIDGTRAPRSPGSTLKPFVYGLALDQGLIHPMTLLADSPRSFGGYDPENFDRSFRGPLPAHEALRSSRNLPAIALASKLKNVDLYTFLQQAGVKLLHNQEHYGLSLVLGSAEVTMRDQGILYAMLANGGLLRPLRLLRDDPAGPPRRMLSPEAAFVTLSMLEDEYERLPQRGNPLPMRLKTGTSNGFRDAWSVGVVGPYVLVVWVGHFNNSPNPLLIGGEAAKPLFTDIARALLHNQSHGETMVDLIAPQESNLHLLRLPVCTATGDVDVSLCANTTPTLFMPGVSPVRPSGVFRKILVNQRTGLRACEPVPGETEEQVHEFWPSELQRLFSRAGYAKPAPPPFDPRCLPEGMPPRILIPKQDVEYQRRLADSANPLRLPLRASLDADASAVFWFADDRYVGESTPNGSLVWEPPTGTTTLRAVDDLGRTTSQKLVVRLVP